MNHSQVIVDMLISFTLIEAIVKPIAKKLTQSAVKWIDSHVDWIPDWLHTSEE